MARGGTLPPLDTGGAPLPALERLKALDRPHHPPHPLALIRGRAPARGNIQLKVTSLFGILSAHEV